MDIVLVQLGFAKILPVRLQFPILMPLDDLLSYQAKPTVVVGSASSPH